MPCATRRAHTAASYIPLLKAQIVFSPCETCGLRAVYVGFQQILFKSLNPQGDPMTYYHRANCKDSNAASIACLRSPVGKAWPRVAMERLYGRRTGRHAGGGKPTGICQIPGEPSAFPDAAVRPLCICPSAQWQPQGGQPIRPFTFQHMIPRRPRAAREGVEVRFHRSRLPDRVEQCLTGIA